MDYWWVISVGVAGGVILTSGLFWAALVLRRVRRRTAMEKQVIEAKSEERMKVLLERATVMGEDLKVVSRELLNVQEEERKKISRELHDEIGQLLATMTVNLELMKKSLEPADEKVLKEKIGEMEQLAGEMFGRIRTFLRELRPTALDDLGLAVVAKRLLHDFSDRTGIPVDLSGEADALNDLDGEKRIIVFRLIQESLTNIVKHSRAGNVRVEVRRDGGYVSLDIADDGVGFTPEKFGAGRGKREGLGILGMRERLRLVDGDFRIDSTPDEGTTIRARVPVAGATKGTFH